MENQVLSLIIGIASSLIATALFISLSEFFRKVVLPWYADKIYRGVRIDGKWTIVVLHGIKIEDENHRIMSFELFQKGDKITGTYCHKWENETSLYHLDGHLRDMLFRATAVPKSSRAIDAVSFLFYVHYEDSKLRLSGSLLCNGKPGEIKSHDNVEFAIINS